MEGSKCINLNLPEVKKLWNQSNIDIERLGAKISIWQQENNSEDIPTLEQLGLEKSSSKKLSFPLQTTEHFSKAIDTLEVHEDTKEQLHTVIDENLSEGYVKVESGDVNSTVTELNKILPSGYVSIEESMSIDGKDYTDIKVINPGRNIDPPLKTISPKLSDETLFNKFSTFFSFETDRRGDNDKPVENYLIGLLEYFGVKINTDSVGINKYLDVLVSKGFLRQDQKDKIFAFVHLLTSGNYTAEIFLRKNQFSTSQLFEEAAHIFVYWMQKHNIEIDGVSYKPWEIPNGTDYLAVTPEYKANYNKSYDNYIFSIRNEIFKLREFRDEYNTTTDVKRKDELSKILTDNATIVLLQATDSDVEEMALRLARIEISGQILGQALKEEVNNKVHPTKESGFLTKVVNWAKSIAKYLKNLIIKAKLDSNKIQGLRDVISSEHYRSENAGVIDRVDQYWEQIQKMASGIVDKSLLPEFDVKKDLGVISIISKEVKNEINKILEKVPDIIKKQKEDLINKLEKIVDFDFLEKYSDYLDNFKVIGQSLGIERNLFVELRKLRKKESQEVLDTVNMQTFAGLSTEGYIMALKPLLEKNSLFGETYWEKYLADILKINIDVTIANAHLSKEEILKEIKNALINYNQNIIDTLVQNVVEDDGSPSSPYESWHGRYEKYLSVQEEIKELNYKEKLLNESIYTDQLQKTVEFFILGKNLEINGVMHNVPSLFKELETMVDAVNSVNKYLQPLRDKVTEAKREWETKVLIYKQTSNSLGSSQEADMNHAELLYRQALEDLKYYRPSKDQYAVLRMKYDYFNDVLNSLGIKNNKTDILKLLPENRRTEAVYAIDEALKNIVSIERYLNENQLDFLKEINDAINTTEDNNRLKNIDENDVHESVKDLRAVDLMLGTRQNFDKFWAHIVAHLKRLSNQAKISSLDQMQKLKEVYDSKIEALEQNPIIKKYIEQTKSKNFKELFHAISKVDGKRTHFLINPYDLDLLQKDQDLYMEEIYDLVDHMMKSLGMNYTLPRGKDSFSIEQRNRILGVGSDIDLTWNKNLKKVQKYYYALKDGFDYNFNESLPENQVDIIKDQKRKELGTYQYKIWLAKSERRIRFFDNQKGFRWVTVRKGDLATPKINNADGYFSLAVLDEDGNSQEVLGVRKKQDYTDNRFKELVKVPEFKAVYDVIHQMQMDSYKKSRNAIFFDRIRAYQSGAFEGSSEDLFSNFFSKNFKSAGKRLMDMAKSIYEINDEEKFVLDKRDRSIPLRGTVAYDDPNRLSDNYFDIISKYWYSIENFRVKNKGLMELEALRTALKNRNVEVDSELKKLRFSSLFGNFFKTEEHTESRNSKRWDQLIDSTYDSILYEEHTDLKLHPGQKVSKRLILAMKLPAVVSYLKISGKPYAAVAARLQGTYNLTSLFMNGRLFAYGTGTLWQKMKQRAAIVHKYWNEDRVNTSIEYTKNRQFTKVSLAQTYFGVSTHSLSQEGNSSIAHNLFTDVFGYGLMAYANSRVFRVATRAALENLRWNKELAMWMNPNQYLSYLQQKNPFSITIEQAEEKFHTLGESVWDILDTQGQSLKIKPGMEASLNVEQRAMISSYLRELYSMLDNSLSDVPEIARTVGSKYLLALKKWLIRWSQELFYTRNNVDLGTTDKSYFEYLKMILQSVINKETRKNLSSGFKYDYEARDIISRTINMMLITIVTDQFATIMTGVASRLCSEDKESFFCWMSAMSSYTAKRTLAEIGGMYSATAIVNNFDKPLLGYTTFYDNIIDLFSIADVPLDLAMQWFTDEEGQKELVKGPYAGFTPAEASMIKLIPAIGGTYEFFNNAAVISRDQLITDQLNRMNIAGIPDLYRLGIGYYFNSFWENQFSPTPNIKRVTRITPKIKLNSEEN